MRSKVLLGLVVVGLLLGALPQVMDLSLVKADVNEPRARRSARKERGIDAREREQERERGQIREQEERMRREQEEQMKLEMRERQERMRREQEEEAFFRRNQDRLNKLRPRALEAIKDIDARLYNLIVENDQVKEEYERLVLEVTRLCMEREQWQQENEEPNNPRLELELKHRVLQGHLNILVERYHSMRKPERRERIQNDLKDLLTRLFDIKLAMREWDIKELQRELNRLKDQVKYAKEHKEEQIESFLARITGRETIFEF